MKKCHIKSWIIIIAVALSLGADTYDMKQNMSSLQIVSRLAWGALEPDFAALAENGIYDSVNNPAGWMVYNQPLDTILKTVVVHHSALAIQDGPREIQILHMQKKGYADIAYHYLIDAEGVIYEGRDLHVRGAHTGGHNTGSVGVVLLGNFEIIHPTDVQIASLTQLLRVLKQEYKVTHLAGHRDFQPDETLCPGKHLASLLPALAGELHFAYGTSGYQEP